MASKIVNYFLNVFSGLTSIPLGPEIFIFLLSASPILELRGGILAATILHMNPIESYIICVIANIIPVPFLLWGMGATLEKMRKSRRFYKFANWLDKKVEKNRIVIEKYGFWGVVGFVGIPVPGTGAWTGCLVASVVDMDKKKAFLATLVGILIASIIMALVSYGLLAKFV